MDGRYRVSVPSPRSPELPSIVASRHSKFRRMASISRELRQVGRPCYMKHELRKTCAMQRDLRGSVSGRTSVELDGIGDTLPPNTREQALCISLSYAWYTGFCFDPRGRSNYFHLQHASQPSPRCTRFLLELRVGIWLTCSQTALDFMLTVHGSSESVFMPSGT
jgi:hypothetical protein